MAHIFTPDDGATVPVLTDAQRRFTDAFSKGSLGDVEVLSWENPPGADEISATWPETVTLSWEDGSRGDLRISRDPEFSSSSGVTVLAHGDASAVLTNLIPGETYFWRAGDAPVRSFKASDSPIRPIRVDMLKNVRDLGGKPTASGKKVKYGLIYRGVRPEHHFSEREELTGDGMRIMICDLGIRTEIDLRDCELTSSPLGAPVRYEQIPFYDFCEVISEPGVAALRSFFQTLCDLSVFPVYVHCAAGADRTGAAIGFLLAFLGVSEDLINLDFVATAPSLVPGERREWEGPSLAAGCKRLLRERYGKPDGDAVTLMRRLVFSLGIPEEKLHSLADFLLE